MSTMDGTEIIDRVLVPVQETLAPTVVTSQFYGRELRLPTGEICPVLTSIDEQVGISSGFQICRGCDSWCSSQCILNSTAKEFSRGNPCPLEVQQANRWIFKLAEDLKTACKAKGIELQVGDVLNELADFSLVSAYINFELIAFRASMDYAMHVSGSEDTKGKGAFGEKMTEGKTGRVFREKVVHPNVVTQKAALDAKIAIQREFLATKRAQLEEKSRSTQTDRALVDLLKEIKDRMLQEERTIEAEE